MLPVCFCSGLQISSTKSINKSKCLIAVLFQFIYITEHQNLPRNSFSLEISKLVSYIFQMKLWTGYLTTHKKNVPQFTELFFVPSVFLFLIRYHQLHCWVGWSIRALLVVPSLCQEELVGVICNGRNILKYSNLKISCDGVEKQMLNYWNCRPNISSGWRSRRMWKTSLYVSECMVERINKESMTKSYFFLFFFLTFLLVS